MWRDKIIEQKKQKNISTKTIAEKTKLSEKTIGRILKGETLFPSVDTVLDIGAAVGLSERELFSEAHLVVGNDDLVRLQTEMASLMDKCVRLEDENDRLRTKLAHKEEILAHKEKIISLYDSLMKEK